MKKIIYLTIIAIILLFLLGCSQTPGTTINPDQGNNEKYNIEKYYYTPNEYIIIATRKDSLPVINTSRVEHKHKASDIIHSVVIDENDRPVKYVSDTVYQYRKEDIILKNDSIIIIRK